ncbi:tetratricopeptide repeat-containing sulfotransferase family protein [Thalassotalea sediminis]|uniref:tetratricopeptide repeat-containing sulfotransferase family protein n=1 Tax=Thalassotalea sediminis TaxID=1759089 RepID=UPI00257309C6|nr:tetratricopeptide repeat-containing sulfotransferase family protein [Thalassotalea sediminis]
MHQKQQTYIQQLIQSGQFEQAREQATSLLQETPNDSELLYLAAVSCRYSAQYQQATTYLEALLTLSPSYGRAYQELGHNLKVLNQPQKAVEHYINAVKFNPSLLASWQAIHDLSSNKEQQITAQHNINYLSHLPKPLQSVLSFIAEDKIEKAEKLCRHFLLQQPKHVEAMRLLAKIAEQHHVLDDAELLLATCLQLEPNNYWAQFDQINVLHKRQKFEIAYEKAVELAKRLPEDPSTMLTLANQEAAVGKYDEAINHYRTLIAKNSNDPLMHLLLGHTLKTIGDQDQATKSYLKAIDINDSFGDAYWSLANLKTFTFPQTLINQMSNVLRQASLNDNDKVQLHFALGKALEINKHYQKSFEHYQQGNRIKRASLSYDHTTMTNNFALQKSFFTKEKIASLSGSGNEAKDPIFILGLPRTGSTLVEQILSSHSDIDGTLELPNILAYVQELNGRKYKHVEAKYPKVLAHLDKSELYALGERYLEETKIYRDIAPYFIDKMPNNFRHIGLIKSILPNAKIIDTRRAPLSCCFSVYKQLFAEGQEFSYDFKDIAEYYKGYCDLMTHWHEVYPQQILTVNYEALVAEPEKTINQMFTYLGFKAEPACFEFYKTKRAVRTASSEQVRQPINQKGVEQWKHYQPYLQELEQYLI